MRLFSLQFKPNKNRIVSFTEFHDESDSEWRYKAEALQNRRWRAPMGEIEGY